MWWRSRGWKRQQNFKFDRLIGNYLPEFINESIGSFTGKKPDVEFRSSECRNDIGLIRAFHTRDRDGVSYVAAIARILEELCAENWIFHRLAQILVALAPLRSFVHRGVRIILLHFRHDSNRGLITHHPTQRGDQLVDRHVTSRR